MTDPAITVYWRPGCGFCRRLFDQLDAHGLSVERRNIWEDLEAATFVRSVADGNETVPTVQIGSRALVNPTFRQIQEALAPQGRGQNA